jgi:DNA-binding SARP family transcriptional activator
MGDRLKTIESILNAPGEVFYGEIDEEGTVSQDVADAERDFNWLINQVKTLQEKLLLETEALEEQYELSLIAKKKIEQYEKALGFYADEDNYFKRVIPPVIESNVVTDKGKVARKALKELTND